MRTQLSAKIAQDKARALEAELNEVRNALLEERKKNRKKSPRQQPATMPSSDIFDPKACAHKGNRTRTSDEATDDPGLPPMAAALFANAEREEREKRLRRSLIGEANDPLLGEEMEWLRRTAVTTAALAGDEENATVIAVTGSNQKASVGLLPAKEPDNSLGAMITSHHVTATISAAAIASEEEDTTLAATRTSNAIRPCRISTTIGTDIEREHSKLFGAEGIKENRPCASSTIPARTNDSGQNVVAGDKKTTKKHNEPPTVEDVREKSSHANSTTFNLGNTPGYDSNSKQLQALCRQCADYVQQREDLRRQLSHSEARVQMMSLANSSATWADKKELMMYFAKERDAWHMERGWLEFSLTQAIVERDCLVEHQQCVAHVAGLLGHLLRQKFSAFLSACMRKRMPQSPYDRMLAVGGCGTTVDPKRETVKSLGAGLGLTIRGWLQLLKTCNTGGARYDGPGLSHGDHMLTDGGVSEDHSKRGTRKGRVAHLGSRARCWLRRSDTSATMGGTQSSDKRQYSNYATTQPLLVRRRRRLRLGH